MVKVFISVENKRNFEQLVEMMEQFNDRFNIILQEFVEDSYGKDLRIIVVGGKVIGLYETRISRWRFQSNVTRGGGGYQ